MDRVRFIPNERIDLADMEASAGGLLQLEEHQRANSALWIPSGRATGSAGTSGRILSGFDFSGTPVGSATATLVRGSAIMPYLNGTVLQFGLLQGAEGPSTAVLDFSAAANGTYSVYVKALFSSAAYENRVFWNPSATAAEFVDSIASRDQATWQATFQDSAAPPPGNGEWVKIYEITVSSFLITVVDDFRHFYYEGSVEDSYAQEWGDGTNDRNVDRTLAPITDHHRFAQMVRRQLTDIVGGAHAGILVPRHLTDLAVEHKSGGNHGDVVADSVRSPESAGAGQGFYMDAYTGFPIAGANARMGSIRSRYQLSSTKRTVLFESLGRIAHPHRFFDDFHYSNWTNLASIPDEPYATTRNGNTEFRVVQTGGGVDVHGGVMTIETTAVAGDDGQLMGPPTWVMDSDVCHLRFMARAALDLAASATRTDRFGIYNGTGLTTWFIEFIRDQATYGDGNWRFRINDGSLGPWTVDTGVAPTADTFQNFYFAMSGEDSVDYWVTGMASPGSLGITGSFATIAQRSRPIVALENNAVATACELYLDFWEVWDDEALGEDMGNNP